MSAIGTRSGGGQHTSLAGCGFLLLMTLIAIAIPGVVIAVSWYRAGVQQRVYARQGIDITQWEVFVGAEPGQKAITIKSGAP